jgi:hypothetical protein
MDSTILRSWNGKTIRHRADGYLSLTDMTQAAGKLLSGWLRLKDTEEYLEALSIDTGLSIRNDEPIEESRYVNQHIALIDIVKGGIPDLQGSWGHGLVALELAGWLNKSLAIQCNKWNMELMTTGSVSLVPKESAIVSTKKSETLTEAKLLGELFDTIFVGTTIDPLLVAGLKANEISKAHPELKSACESAKKLLPLPVQAELLRATDLAEQLTEATGIPFSARSINKFLIEHEYQYKNPLNEPPYLPTEKGNEFAKVVLQEANGNNKTVQQLRWFSGIVDCLKSLVGG